MRRSTILLSTTAVLVAGAGLVLGRITAHFPLPPHPEPDHNRSWFQDQLQLTPDQKKNMDGIWADAKQQADKLNDQRRSIDKDRDAAIKALLTPEQAAAYDKIFADARAKHADLDKQRDALFHAANDKSRALLTADQQSKWDAMQKDMHDHHGPGGPGGRMHGGPGDGPHGPGDGPHGPGDGPHGPAGEMHRPASMP